MATVRVVIAMVATKGWSLHQMDVKNSFLHGALQEEVYMMQPEGYQDDAYPHFVCRLRKALCGLKQAPKAWLDKIDQYLVTIGFQISDADFSLYVKRTDRGIVLVVIYVDDLIVMGDSDADICYASNIVLAHIFVMHLSRPWATRRKGIGEKGP